MPSMFDLVARSLGITPEQLAASYQADAAAAAAAPAIEWQRCIVPAVLAGRCADGNERGRGRLVHAIEADVAGDRVRIASAAALCGATYGRRSAGWSEAAYNEGLAYTCARCARRAATIPQQTKMTP